MMVQPTLRIDGVGYSYGGRRALDGVDLAIAGGEICALIGPNGAGKSTLIRLVCGRLSPEAGAVRVLGGDPASDPRVRSAIGLVPQEIALYPKLTVRENLAAFADLAGQPSADIGRALAQARAEAIADRRVETLSGGEQRRANIAAALSGEPRLLVLDEPTVGVDSHARAAIHDALRAIRDSGVAMLIATHDLDQAESLADQVALIADGRITSCGNPKDLIAATFGADAVEVTALFAEAPVEQERDAMSKLGLSPADGDLRWTCVAAGRDRALQLQEAIAGLSNGAVELRVRNAGLAALLAARAGAAAVVRA